MNSEKENIVDDLLQKWFNGDIRQAEEKQLNQLAADDPFLAEAMDGYEAFPEKDHGIKVRQIKADLRNRYQEKKRRPGIIFYRTAAAIAVLVISLVGFWIVNPTMQRSESALQFESAEDRMKEEKSELDLDAETIVAPALEQEEESIEVNSEKPTTEKTTVPENKPTVRLNPTIQFAEITAPEKIAPRAKDELIEEATLADDAITENADAFLNKPADNLSRIEPASEPVTIVEDSAGKEKIASTSSGQVNSAPAPKEENKDIAVRKINGQITDENGDGLIGAAVYIPETNQGTVTDFDGNYELEIGDEIAELIISYTGFQEQRVILGQDDTLLNVQLSQGDVALDEVTVTGYSLKKTRAQKRKMDALSNSTASSAHPSVGNKKMNRYLKKNLQYPADAKAANIAGEVIVSFIVSNDGTLSNFMITSSLYPSCDEEAIRLLQEGPKWEIKGNASEVPANYTVVFKLGKKAEN